VLLAAFATVGLTLMSDPFGYDSWTRPPAPEPVSRVIEVEPVRAPVAPRAPRVTPAPSEVREQPRRRADEPARRAQRRPAEPAPQGGVAGVERESSGPSENSGPGSGSGGGDSGPGSSGGESSGPGPSMAESGRALPADTRAKRSAARVGESEPHARHTWREDRGRKRGRGHGRGQKRGHGRHGHGRKH
jgi:hypothetical protein